MELRTAALAALAEPDIDRKLDQTRALRQQCEALALEAWPIAPGPLPASALALAQGLPGRPARPLLAPPAQVPRRSVHTPQGRAALVHAICHIEFNAVNLALDAIWRFAGMPAAFYRDWLRVADEEVKHFRLLHAHLQSMGHAYGDFDAHDGLWAMCESTRHDLTARMALVPRTLEARGLDATPQIQARLRATGAADALAACDILDIILRDEVGHVAIGNHWYAWLCAQQGLEPVAHYARLAREHKAPRLKGPFNLEARARAGFSADELKALTTAEQDGPGKAGQG